MQTCFKALETCVDTAIYAVMGRSIFQDVQVTKGVQISFSNWNQFCSLIDSFVEQKMKSYQNREDKDAKATCFVDIMLQEDVYKGNVQKMANDLMVAMLAGTDTSKNVTILLLNHLIKIKANRQRVRDEIEKTMEKYKISEVMNMGHKQLGQSDLQYLWWAINESMRYNPVAVASEEYIMLQDCQLGKFKIPQGDSVAFFIYGAHHNPSQWREPSKFLPERFDPDSEYFKKPNGEPRHPMSFVPFGVGERKCLGYMFAKTIIPSLTAKIMHTFDFEFVDGYMYKPDWHPIASLLLNNYPSINVNVNQKSS